MPVFRFDKAFRLARGIKAFLKSPQRGVAHGAMSETHRGKTEKRKSIRDGQKAKIASQSNQSGPVSGVTPRSKAHSEQNLTPRPFIVGVPRSGTTLLRLMLDAHPDLAIPPETNFIHHVAEACKHASCPQQAFLETVMAHNRWKDLHIEGDLLTQSVADIEPFDLSEAMRTLYRLYAEKFGKPRWGDKTPQNVRRMSLIQEILPEAHFVHVIRDGRDVALSVMDLWFGANSIEEAARRWRGNIEKARRHSKNLSHYLEIRYEDLVSDTELTLRKISDFINLPWDSRMLDYHKTAGGRLSELERNVYAPNGEIVVRGKEHISIHSLTNKPPQRDRIGRWRKEMTDTDRKRFEKVAGDMLEQLGYDVG